MSSFLPNSSVKLGVDMLELDCQLTKDEQVVISHDNDLLRGTGVAKHISELAFDELPQYSDELDVTFGFGKLYISFRVYSIYPAL